MRWVNGSPFDILHKKAYYVRVFFGEPAVRPGGAWCLLQGIWLEQEESGHGDEQPVAGRCPAY